MNPTTSLAKGPAARPPDGDTDGHTRGAARRRWPLLLIGAAAGTATWSGWVGLGERTGFGLVQPLPGIWDGLTINTAVTLPLGVEAYAVYALSVATTATPLPTRTRRYAWGSAAAALALGMAGQVAYHVLAAHTPTNPNSPTAAGAVTGEAVPLAPWWLIAAVSCLPVLVLGAASLLWHLAGTAEPHHPTRSADPHTDPASDPLAYPRTGPTSDGRPSGQVTARPEDLARAQAAIASGDLSATPTAAALREHLHISPAYARATRDALAVAHPGTPQSSAEAPAPPSTPSAPPPQAQTLRRAAPTSLTTTPATAQRTPIFSRPFDSP